MFCCCCCWLTDVLFGDLGGGEGGGPAPVLVGVGICDGSECLC